MNWIKNSLKTVLNSYAAGICIGIGGTVYLMCPSKPLGAFLFAVGLCTILLFGLNLYTGMVGYLFDNKPAYIIKLLIVWFGNFAGTATVGELMRLTRLSKSVSDAADSVVTSKLDDGFGSLFILGIFCGILMFVGVDTFKKHWAQKDFAAIFMPVICVAVFIVAGFEHCIADMFYFASAGKGAEGFSVLLAVTLGNSLGGVIIPVIKKLTDNLSRTA